MRFAELLRGGRASARTPDLHIAGRLMQVDDGLRRRLADPDGSHRRAVLAEINRHGGGAVSPARVPIMAGAAAPVVEESAEVWPPRVPAVRPGTRPEPFRRPGWYVLFTCLADLLGLGLPLLGVLRHSHGHGASAGWASAGWAVAAAAVWTGLRALRGRYRRDTLGERPAFRPAVADWTVMLALSAVGYAVAEPAVHPRALLPAFAVSLAATVTAARLTEAHRARALRSAHAVHRVLLLGEPDALEGVIDRLASRTDHAYLMVGAVTVGDGPLRSPVLERLPESARSTPADSEPVLRAALAFHADLVLAVPGARLTGQRLRRISWSLDGAGLPLAVVPGLVDVDLNRLTARSAAGLTVLHVGSSRHATGLRLVKSALDVTGAAVLLVLLAPVFLAVAVAIKATSPGPVIYRQTRYRRGGVPFVMWKFRTMVNNADARKLELGSENAAAGDGLMFKMRRDPRVTSIGRFLRRTSLDELPQLVNVLRGEMSLVGPRPPLPEEVERYDSVEMRRLAVKPGLTGLWQVSGRSDLSWDETVSLDLRYVDNWSLRGDLGILFRTLRAVVDGRGAY
ncbi:sugar transferase [Actinacidiphila yeochonensis]|uniref:sugar transferase n=1 Tax=Actinacidiphila yeochonensis TaxID=89050 RepID=UPI000AD64A01|nr:sugar transferase [Actinacidiphila yeochonensis]